MALMATRMAAASRSPQARSFQISTIAMQRASPTMIRPVRYVRQVRQQQPRQGEHQRRADHPVEQDRGHQQPLVAGDVAELVVADLGQHRVHHHQQPDGDRQRHRPDLDRGERVVEAGDRAGPAAGRATMAAMIQTGRNRSRVESCLSTRVALVSAGLVHGVAHAPTPASSPVAASSAPALKRLPSAAIASGRAL